MSIFKSIFIGIPSMGRLGNLFVVFFFLIAIYGCGSRSSSGPIGATNSVINGSNGGSNPSASVSGPVLALRSVQDGTTVALNRIDDSGQVVKVIATTTTSGGQYSFDLPTLGVSFASNLTVQVADPSTGTPIRAFVVQGIVNIDSASESAVRLVLEAIAKGPDRSLSQFTSEELVDLAAALDLLAMIKQDESATDLEESIKKIRQDFLANPDLVHFLDAASASGQTAVATGDVGNFFPRDAGNLWRFKGTRTASGSGTSNYFSSVAISGTRMVNGVVNGSAGDVYLFGSSDPLDYSEEYRIKDSSGITFQGDNDPQPSPLTSFLPYQEVRFPLKAGDTFVQFEKKNIDAGDLDGDGIHDLTAIQSQVRVEGFENVNVPAGLFVNAAKITTDLTISTTLSKDNTTVSSEVTTSEWYAPGIGLVKSTAVVRSNDEKQTSTESEEEELIGMILDGQGQGVRIPITPPSTRVTKGVHVTASVPTFDPSVHLSWISGNPAVATVASSFNSNGDATAVGPGTAVLFATQNGQISDPAFLIVEDLKTVKIAAGDLVYSPLTQKLYASAAIDSSSSAATITTIDPLTGEIGPSLSVGAMVGDIISPGTLALSKDGRYLYLGLSHLSGSGGVRTIDLSTWTVGPAFSPVPGGPCGSSIVYQIKVLPDNPNAVAIPTAVSSCPPIYEVAIYDNGVLRPGGFSSQTTGPITIEFADTSSTLYGYGSGTFYRMSVDINGVQVKETVPGLLTASAVNFKFDNGKLYIQGGQVIDPVSWTWIGSYSGLAGRVQFQPDSSVKRTFSLVGSTFDCFDYAACRVLVFDQESFKLIDSITIDVSHYDPPGPAVGLSMIRWGSDGLAILTTGAQLILVRSPLISGH